MDSAYELNTTSLVPVTPTVFNIGYPQESGSPTVPGAWWFHMITEELRNALVTASVTPNPADLSQLSRAIIALSNAGSDGLGANIVSVATATEAIVNNQSGKRFVNATAGIVAYTLPVPAIGLKYSIAYSAYADTVALNTGSFLHADGSTGAATLTLPSVLGGRIELECSSGTVWQVRTSGRTEIANAVNANEAVALGQFVTSKLTNGYHKTPDGLIIQWGLTGAIAAGAATTFAFPIAFPTAAVFATQIPVTLNGVSQTAPTISSLSLTSCAGTNATGITNTYYTFAIGY